MDTVLLVYFINSPILIFSVIVAVRAGRYIYISNLIWQRSCTFRLTSLGFSALAWLAFLSLFSGNSVEALYLPNVLIHYPRCLVWSKSRHLCSPVKFFIIYTSLVLCQFHLSLQSLFRHIFVVCSSGRLTSFSVPTKVFFLSAFVFAIVLLPLSEASRSLSRSPSRMGLPVPTLSRSILGEVSSVLRFFAYYAICRIVVCFSLWALCSNCVCLPLLTSVWSLDKFTHSLTPSIILDVQAIWRLSWWTRLLLFGYLEGSLSCLSSRCFELCAFDFKLDSRLLSS